MGLVPGKEASLELLATLVNGLMPASISFGPLFLVIEGKTPRYTRTLRVLGVAMMMFALMTSWLMIEKQRGEISLLQQRLENLESSRSSQGAPSAPCPPGQV
jgi:hypothetical protein